MGDILQQLGLPLREVIRRCALNELPEEGKLGRVRSRLEVLFGQYHRQGHSIGTFLGELREELDFSMGEEFKGLLLFTAKVKFFVLAFFYFPAYLIFVFSLFGELLPS